MPAVASFRQLLCVCKLHKFDESERETKPLINYYLVNGKGKKKYFFSTNLGVDIYLIKRQQQRPVSSSASRQLITYVWTQLCCK